MRIFPGTTEAFIVVVLTVGCACACISTLARYMHVLNIKCVCRCISVEEAGMGMRGRDVRERVDRDSFYMFISNVASSADVSKKLFHFYASYNYFFVVD